MTRVLLLASVVLLGGCAGGFSRHCMGELEYQNAVTIPPPSQVDGLRVPESPSALRIPPPPAEPVPFAQQKPDPKNPERMRTQCLDIPPVMRPEEPVADTVQS